MQERRASEAWFSLFGKSASEPLCFGHSLIDMRKWIPVLLLLPVILGLLWAAQQFSQGEPPPTYRESLRESRPLLPLLRGRAGGLVEAEIFLRAGGGSAPLARALSRGIRLRIRGEVAPGSSMLRFRLRSGDGVARWQEIEKGSKQALVVSSTPYRYPGSFLRASWSRDMLPGRLLRIWKTLPPRAGEAKESDREWEYRINSRSRFARTIKRSVPLFRAFRGRGDVWAFFDRSSGAPGGFRWSTRTSPRKTAGLLGLEPSLLGDMGPVSWQVGYRVIRWGGVEAPGLPQKLYPRGEAALEDALLPFYVGLQK